MGLEGLRLVDHGQAEAVAAEALADALLSAPATMILEPVAQRDDEVVVVEPADGDLELIEEPDGSSQMMPFAWMRLTAR